MKAKIKVLIGLFLVFGLGSASLAQKQEEQLVSLNKILEKSLYKSVITIDKGVVSRKDNNNNSATYKSEDVIDVFYDFDGFHNAIVKVAVGKSISANINTKVYSSRINVIAFQDIEDCKEAIKIMKKLFL